MCQIFVFKLLIIIYKYLLDYGRGDNLKYTPKIIIMCLTTAPIIWSLIREFPILFIGTIATEFTPWRYTKHPDQNQVRNFFSQNNSTGNRTLDFFIQCPQADNVIKFYYYGLVETLFRVQPVRRYYSMYDLCINIIIQKPVEYFPK